MGTIVLNPPSIPNTEADSWQPLVLRDAMSYYGLNKISLTNWDETTTLPQIAQGSLIDIDGSLAEFIADEAITGAPADGTVYVYFTVAGDVVTPALTNTAPAWYADKGGWYDDLGNRYSGHVMTKAGAVYTFKSKWRDEASGEAIEVGGNGHSYITSLSVVNMMFKNPPRVVTRQFTSLEVFPLPAGTYMFTYLYPTNSYNPFIDMLMEGQWIEIGSTSPSVPSYLFATEGTYRLRAGSFGSAAPTSWIEFD